LGGGAVASSAGEQRFSPAGLRVSRPPDGAARANGNPRQRSFAAALGLTVLGAVVPRTGLLAAGRRVLGALTLVVFLLLAGAGA
jgi:hypothetical protein